MSSIARFNLFRKNVIALQRSIWTGRPFSISEKAFQKFKLKQARMQCLDDLPTYLKSGVRDKILYWTTLGLIMYGTIQSIKGVLKLTKDY